MSYSMDSTNYPLNNWGQESVTWKSFQYADETTFFSHAKVRNLSEAIDDMGRTLDRLYIARDIFKWIGSGCERHQNKMDAGF